MSSSLWDDLKKTLIEGVNVAAEKTEEYTKIGKVRVDLLNLNRKLDKTYKALGREIYVRVSDGKKIDAHKDEGISYFIEKINHITAAIMKNEKLIVEIKKAANEKARQQLPEKGAPAEEQTPEKESGGKKDESAEKSAPAAKKPAAGKSASGSTAKARKKTG